MRRHNGRVLALCLSMVGSTDAEEAAQETFLKAYRAIGDFSGDSEFSTWIHRIAANQCLDILRRRAREKTDSWDALLEHEGGRVERLLASERDASAAAEASDLAGRILGELPPDYRLVITLRELQGLSYDEIAKVLDCSLDSVKARLRRARLDLQKKLRHFLGTPSV